MSAFRMEKVLASLVVGSKGICGSIRGAPSSPGSPCFWKGWENILNIWNKQQELFLFSALLMRACSSGVWKDGYHSPTAAPLKGGASSALSWQALSAGGAVWLELAVSCSETCRMSSSRTSFPKSSCLGCMIQEVLHFSFKGRSWTFFCFDKVLKVGVAIRVGVPCAACHYELDNRTLSVTSLLAVLQCMLNTVTL